MIDNVGLSIRNVVQAQIFKYFSTVGVDALEVAGES